MKILLRSVCGLAVLVLLFWAWYVVAADYGYKAVSGKYRFSGDGEISTLILSRDHSFRQELNRSGSVEHAQGSWRRIGEGGVVFSKEFLRVAGQTARPDGQVDGQIVKRYLELVPSIAFEPEGGGPVFYKKWF
jgi:hypothetical protein